MKKSLTGILLGCACVAWVAALLHATHASPQLNRPSALIDFARQLQPILEKHCLECHSQDKRKGGLSLATYGDLLDGGKDGAVVRPGNSVDSLLVHRVLGQVEPQMPKDEDPLSVAQIALIRLWIDQGARLTPASPPAPPPWEAPLALVRPDLPPAVWPTWTSPIDRIVAAYLAKAGIAEPPVVSDALFARRVFLDAWGLLPAPEALQAFLQDPAPDKRERLVARLLSDDPKYAAHWMSFWNDLLRNEDGVTYFSETAGRKSITDWLLASLSANLPYDQFVSTLLNPSSPGDPDGFLVGVNWRGETSAAVTPWMQASQNAAQIFLGVNLKCNACHDSFISKWKLKDAYALAGFFSPDPKLQLFRCEVAQDKFAEPGFLFPELNRTPASSSLADRRATVAAIFTDRRNGRLPRTLVNRIWQRLVGSGIVANQDDMGGRPWSAVLLDWAASDFVEHRYDVKRLIATVLSSRAYQMPAVPRTAELSARDYVFRGPEVRRMTAEQFADAIGSITGEWSVYQPARGAARPAAGVAPSDPPSAGVYGRQWRAASSNLTRALGRPIRDQVLSVRPSQSTTLQALELVNGEMLTQWLARGARRMLDEIRPEPLSLFNKAVAGRNATSIEFDIDVAQSSSLWLIVTDTGSNEPRRVLPIWADAELIGPSGATPLSSLEPADLAGLKASTTVADLAGLKASTTVADPAGLKASTTGADPAGLKAGTTAGGGVRVTNPSRLVYDIAGRGFTRFHGRIGLENARSEIGATLDPQIRFFVFDAEPNMDRLVPPAPGLPMPAAPPVKTMAEAVDRVFRYALGRAPAVAERRDAEAALRDPSRPGHVLPEGLADLLWAVMMKPEFQLIY